MKIRELFRDFPGFACKPTFSFFFRFAPLVFFTLHFCKRVFVFADDRPPLIVESDVVICSLIGSRRNPFLTNQLAFPLKFSRTFVSAQFGRLTVVMPIRFL